MNTQGKVGYAIFATFFAAIIFYVITKPKPEYKPLESFNRICRLENIRSKLNNQSFSLSRYLYILNKVDSEIDKADSINELNNNSDRYITNYSLSDALKGDSFGTLIDIIENNEIKKVNNVFIKLNPNCKVIIKKLISSQKILCSLVTDNLCRSIYTIPTRQTDPPSDKLGIAPLDIDTTKKIVNLTNIN